MKTYLVYDQKSGNIVHVHNETGESRRKPEDVLRYVHPSVGRAHLESVEIESGQMRDVFDLRGSEGHDENRKERVYGVCAEAM